jgi:hypothetical protein
MMAEPIRSMNANEDGSVTGYMCAIDWECELGAASDGNRVYPSVEALKHGHKCWEDCGIVEVRVFFAALHTEGKMEQRMRKVGAK